MNLTLINPNIVSQKNDLSGSGIPYMPLGLAHLAGYLRSRGHALTVIDAFGERLDQVRSHGDHYIQGLTAEETVARIPADTEALGFYAHLTVAHTTLLEVIRLARARFPQRPMLVLENINKVNAYSLRRVAPEFFALGVDYLVLGMLEWRTERLLAALGDPAAAAALDGVIARAAPEAFRPPRDFTAETDLDSLPLPAWDLFPLENYWRLGYAHAPLTTDKYLPLLTSRGCPFNCGFCVSPEMSGRHWKGRSPEHVVAEIAYFQERYGVREFHIEDLNPTLNTARILALSRLLSARPQRIIWKLAQGTKLETLTAEAIDAMARAGCTYVSISPESGSAHVAQLMGKPIDLDHAVAVVRRLRARGVYTQCCFVLGYPGEQAGDRALTARLVRRLARLGADEVALFIITPMPGSKIFEHYRGRFDSLDQLTFTPQWREDIRELARCRRNLYLQYALLKALCHPLRTLGYGWALLTGRFQTKVEMTLYRKLKTAWLALRRTPAA